MTSKLSQPYVTIILAMSVDGKISNDTQKPARFSSKADLQHLEQQISLCDAIIFGGNTLRAYGTTLTIKNEQLLEARKKRNQTTQPINIVCSNSGNLDPQCNFFHQPINRILLTTIEGLNYWNCKINQPIIKEKINLFHQCIITENNNNNNINWNQAFKEFQTLKFNRIGILGGGQLIASLCAENLINDLWLTICPIILGGEKSPTPVAGNSLKLPLPLKLLELKQIEQELFLHYEVIKEKI